MLAHKPIRCLLQEDTTHVTDGDVKKSLEISPVVHLLKMNQTDQTFGPDPGSDFRCENHL